LHLVLVFSISIKNLSLSTIKVTGGARIGMANATWPFATLRVNKDKLQLNTSFFGNLVFKPGDIVSIEPYMAIPLLGQGIKINHAVKSYNQKVIFWTLEDPIDLIHRIKQTGFLNNHNPPSAIIEEHIRTTQAQGRFPIKTPAIISIIVVWNLFMLFDIINFITGKNSTSILSIGAQSALGFVLIFCILLLMFEPFRQLILKKGRTIDDIKSAVYFIIFVCGSMLLILSFNQ